MVDSIDTPPAAIVQRRDDIQRHLDKLLRFLATDIPETERAIALKQFEALHGEALLLGMEMQP
jgi:hypothetical protein